MSVHLSFLPTLADARLVDGLDEVLLYQFLWLKVNMVRPVIRHNHLQASRVKLYVWLIVDEVQKKRAVIMWLSTVFKPSRELIIWTWVYSGFAHFLRFSIWTFMRPDFSNQLIKLEVLYLFDIEIEIALGVILLEDFTKLHCILSFLKSSFIVADLLSSLTTNVGSILWLCQFESLVVVRANAILIRPEHPNEGSIASFLPLWFPTAVINLDHDLIVNPLADVLRRSFSELLDEIVLALLLIIDCCFLKMVNHPFIVGRSHWDVSLDDLFDLLLGYLIVLFLEAPVFFGGVLSLVIYWVKVAHIPVWDHCLRVFRTELLVLEVVVRIM
jgi:hypothetical protein